METQETSLSGLKLIKPKVFEDDRGYFFECHNLRKAESAGLADFVQDNISKSSYGVVRGLHFQLPPHSQAKLVCVLSGEVLDVAVDLRKDSPTYLQHYSQVLSEENKLQMFIPPGFAHGFAVLSKEAIFYYKCSNYFEPKADSGIAYNDPLLKIDWRLKESDRIVSAKDQQLPLLKDVDLPF